MKIRLYFAGQTVPEDVLGLRPIDGYEDHPETKMPDAVFGRTTLAVTFKNKTHLFAGKLTSGRRAVMVVSNGVHVHVFGRGRGLHLHPSFTAMVKSLWAERKVSFAEANYQ